MNNKIKEIRLLLKMSRKDFGAAIGVIPGAVANYESGIRLPKIHTGYRIIDIARKKGLRIKLEDIYPRPDSTHKK